MAKRDGDYILVAGLDFGTTYSGYGFSFRTEPEKIICNKNWGSEYGFQSHKTPTSILTNDAGDFVAMGYKAEQQYSQEIEENGSGVNLHLYRHFKMNLKKSKEVSLKSVVTSDDGTIAPAISIFGYAIDYLRKHLIAALKTKTGREPAPSSIFWVITVPAIWGQQSKTFMREAAKRGGCVSDASAKNLLLALEPEAASLYCRRLDIARYQSDDGIAFPPETKYLVLDCGGGTVDITAHRTLQNENIEEILPASGGAWGGMYVNRQFEQLLGRIFGNDFLNGYKSSHPEGWLQLISSFEMAKKPFNGVDENVLRVSLPWTFSEFHLEAKQGKPMKKTIEQYNNPDVSFKNGSIMVKNATARQLYSEVIKDIIIHVQGLLANPKMQGCRYVFMVGGFSESRFLQNEMKQCFEENRVKVLVPSDAQMAVLKGAVLFGHSPTEIANRIARKTYGYQVALPYKPTIHREISWKDAYGVPFCDGIFEPFIKQGEPVDIGEENSLYIEPATLNQPTLTTAVYAIDAQPRSPVQYIDAPEVEKVGEIVLNLQPCSSLEENGITSIFTFGNTEIHVRVIHHASGKVIATSMKLGS